MSGFRFAVAQVVQSRPQVRHRHWRAVWPGLQAEVLGVHWLPDRELPQQCIRHFVCLFEVMDQDILTGDFRRDWDGHHDEFLQLRQGAGGQHALARKSPAILGCNAGVSSRYVRPSRSVCRSRVAFWLRGSDSDGDPGTPHDVLLHRRGGPGARQDVALLCWRPATATTTFLSMPGQ